MAQEASTPQRQEGLWYRLVNERRRLLACDDSKRRRNGIIEQLP
jgi:hypothetical protein